jgi:hypothetical protein
MAML